jgi:hypothetical protein
MRTTLTLFVLSTCMAFGQDANVQRVFQLHHIEAGQPLAEFTTMIRVMSEIPDVSSDAAKKNVSVRGTASQIAIAEFLFTELDRQTVPDSVTQELRVANNSDDILRIFFLPNAATVRDFQEIATTVRTVVEIKRVMTYNTKALAVRGTADQVAATEFLVKELDQPAAAKRTDSPVHQMIDMGNRGDTALRVYYLPYTATVQQFQNVATVIRNIGEIRRVFTYNSPRALIVRGTPEQIAFSGWMVQELGKPLQAEASPTYHYGNDRDGTNMVRLFYVKDAPTVAAFQQIATQIRTNAKIRRVFTYNETNAIALRGTEAQLEMAEQMLHDRQIASK